jgi:hypothetical protein
MIYGTSRRRQKHPNVCLHLSVSGGPPHMPTRTTVIKHLNKFLADPMRMTIRFSFDYQSSKNMILPQLMEFMLKQLLYHRALSSTTEKLLRYRAKPPSRPNESEILTLLQEEIRTYTRVFLVLDALDESPGEMGMSICHFILDNLPNNVSLLCTSRDIPETTRSFDGEMRMDIIAHDSDLRVYLHSYFQLAPKLRALIPRVVPALNEEAISSDVLDKAGGM